MQPCQGEQTAWPARKSPVCGKQEVRASTSARPYTRIVISSRMSLKLAVSRRSKWTDLFASATSVCKACASVRSLAKGHLCVRLQLWRNSSVKTCTSGVRKGSAFTTAMRDIMHVSVCETLFVRYGAASGQPTPFNTSVLPLLLRVCCQ